MDTRTSMLNLLSATHYTSTSSDDADNKNIQSDMTSPDAAAATSPPPSHRKSKRYFSPTKQHEAHTSTRHSTEKQKGHSQSFSLSLNHATSNGIKIDVNDSDTDTDSDTENGYRASSERTEAEAQSWIETINLLWRDRLNLRCTYSLPVITFILFILLYIFQRDI